MSPEDPVTPSDSHLDPPEAVLARVRSLPRSTSAAPATPAPGPQDTLHKRVGGDDFFVRLVDAFYSRVAEDPVLRPLYPEPELSGANERLRLFLIQYWGGPSTYSQTRGHPRLRMRHAPFPVGTDQITAWLAAMRGAIDELDPPADIAEELWAYMERSAHFMRNQPLD